MRSHLAFVSIIVAGASAASASATPQALEFAVENTGKTTLACNAAIAHWYSANLGDVAPGANLSFSFGIDVDTGTVFQMNTVGNKMAVQRVWCGRKGDDWQTRAEIPLERRAGVAPEPIRLRCTGDGEKTGCVAQ